MHSWTAKSRHRFADPGLEAAGGYRHLIDHALEILAALPSARSTRPPASGERRVHIGLNCAASPFRHHYAPLQIPAYPSMTHCTKTPSQCTSLLLHQIRGILYITLFICRLGPNAFSEKSFTVRICLYRAFDLNIHPPLTDFRIVSHRLVRGRHENSHRLFRMLCIHVSRPRYCYE